MTDERINSEVGVVPADWCVRPLLKIVNIARGQVDPRQEPYRSMILLAPDHIESGSGRLLERRTAAEQGAISGKYLFSAGDIVYSKIRPYLRKATLVDFGGLCSADMYPLRPAASVAGRFILETLLGHRFTKYAQSVSVRSGMPKINRVELAAFSFALPPTKAEQDAIAGALADADAWIESLEKLIVKKRQVKHGAMQQLLTGKRRLSGCSGEWQTARLGGLADIQRGASPRPIDDPIWFDENSPIGWVRISDVTSSGMFLRNTTQRLSPLGVKRSRPVPSGSLIMSICATVGRPIITAIDSCIHDGFVVMSSLRIEKFFCYYLLARLEPMWSQHGQTGSQMNLNTDLIRRTEVVVPPTKSEQAAIAEVLREMDEELDKLAEKLEKARQIKVGITQNLLTGKVRLR